MDADEEIAFLDDIEAAVEAELDADPSLTDSLADQVARMIARLGFEVSPDGHVRRTPEPGGRGSVARTRRMPASKGGRDKPGGRRAQRAFRALTVPRALPLCPRLRVNGPGSHMRGPKSLFS